MTEMKNALKSRLQNITRRFAENMPGQIAAIKAAHEHLTDVSDHGEPSGETSGETSAETSAEISGALDKLIFPIHRLAGTAATFGFHSTGQTAANLESLLMSLKDQGGQISDQDLQHIAVLIETLESNARSLLRDRRDGDDGVPNEPIERPPAEAAPPTPFVGGAAPEDDDKTDVADANPMVYIVDGDRERGGDLAAQLGLFGYDVRVFSRTTEMLDAIRLVPPVALITEANLPEGNMAGIEMLHAVNAERKIPSVVISAKDDLPTRLAAVRAGAIGFYGRPVDISNLGDTLDRATSALPSDPYRVLIVDDDRTLAQFNALHLQNAGMKTKIVTDPLTIMDPMVDFRPDIILMDINMPGCNGIELAGVIRQRQSLAQIPIIFLTAEAKLDNRLLAIQTGGDDFLTKPPQLDFLISSVSSRAKRARQLNDLISKDSMTGLINHSKIKEQLDIEIKRSRRENQPLAFAMIDIDHFKRVNDTHGHWVGDSVIKTLARVLRQRLRKTDIVGRYGGEEFAVILVNTDGPTAVKLLDKIRDGFSRIHHLSDSEEFHATFSGGVATRPSINDATELITSADGVLYEAKNNGRNRIVLFRP